MEIFPAFCRRLLHNPFLEFTAQLIHDRRLNFQAYDKKTLFENFKVFLRFIYERKHCEKIAVKVFCFLSFRKSTE